jgi:hypothetical protein
VTSQVERVSRFTVLLQNPNRRIRPVMGKITKAVRDLPHVVRRSISFDRGIEVPEHFKIEQDKAPPKKGRAGKQRSRYKPNGRRNDGWNSLDDRKRIADRKASRARDI